MAGIKSDDDGTRILLSSSSSCSPLLTTLSHLRREETDKDVSIRCKAGVEVRCHSPVLYAFCSLTFRNILNSVSLMDEEQVLVVMEEVDAEDVESFLDLIYLGRCQTTEGLQFLIDDVFQIEFEDINMESNMVIKFKSENTANSSLLMEVKNEPNDEHIEDNAAYKTVNKVLLNDDKKQEITNLYLKEITMNLLKTASDLLDTNDDNKIETGCAREGKFCPYCKEGFPDGRGNEQFVNHLMVHVKGRNGWCCNQCEFKSSQRKALASHVKTIHLSRNDVLCPECGENFGSDILFKKHHKKVHGGLTYDCEQCDFKAVHHSDLHRHKQRVHEGQKYVCDQCEYQCKYKQDLKRHILSVHEGVRYHCDQCNYKATEQGSLRKHKLAIHDGVKYACDQCDYAATYKRNLTIHVRNIHEGSRYDCDLCEHKAKSKSNLWVHKQGVHKNVKYFCELCGYQASRKSYLNVHKMSKHPEQLDRSRFDMK